MNRFKTRITKWLTKWLTKTLGLDVLAAQMQNTDNSMNRLHDQMQILLQMIKEHTSVSADINFSGGSYIVLVGRYKNNDYIKISPLCGSDFACFAKQLEEMERYHRIDRIDSIPRLRGAFNRF